MILTGLATPRRSVCAPEAVAFSLYRRPTPCVEHHTMAFTSWLRSSKTTSRSRRQTRRGSHCDGARKRPPRVPLLLERLEDRTVPATVNWDGGGGDTDWNNRFNWDTNTLPGAGDDVQIGSAY